MDLRVGDETKFTILLTAAVDAEFSVTLKDEKVRASGEKARTGVYDVTIVALEAGATEIEVTARANGYRTATASIPVTVEAIPPIVIRGTVRERNGSPVEDAVVSIVDPATGEVEGADITDRSGRFHVDELEGDRYRVEVVALGYEPVPPRTVTRTRFRHTFDVFFTLDPTAPPLTLPFNFSRRFWDSLVFDALDCPKAGTCEPSGNERLALHDRRMWRLATGSRTNFHIRTHSDSGGRRLSSARVGLIRLAIADAMDELTGSFRGRITSGPENVERSGTVTIHGLSSREFESEYGDYCGWAWIGRDPGGIYLNTGLISATPKRGYCTLEPLVLHEIGHALGFYHVPGGNVMANPIEEHYSFSPEEQTHGRLAYQLQRGALYPGYETLLTLLGGKEAGPADPPVGVGCHPDDLTHSGHD